eukprot:914495-Alexandrium_andersonii.AAC.1
MPSWPDRVSLTSCNAHTSSPLIASTKSSKCASSDKKFWLLMLKSLSLLMPLAPRLGPGFEASPSL